jgi:hypothetical protein
MLELTVYENLLYTLRIPPEWKKLKIIRASDNNLHTVELPPNLDNMIELNLSENVMTKIDLKPGWTKLAKVDISGNIFTVIDVPHDWVNIKELILATNNLAFFTVPETCTLLEVVDASNNNLDTIRLWPSFTNLQALHLSENKLKAVVLYPEWEKLMLVDLAYNKISDINFPTNLKKLKKINLMNNLLNSVPEALFDLAPEAQISVGDNPLFAQVREMLAGLQEERGNELLLHNRFLSPAFILSIPRIYGSRDPAVTPALHKIMEYIFPGTSSDVSVWQMFEHEENAHTFSDFIDRLVALEFVRESSEFRKHIAEWASEWREDESLRKQTFLRAQQATGSCEDRIALIYNDMQRLRLINGLESKRYDKDLSGFFTHLRELFRHDRLEKVAIKRIEALRRSDEIRRNVVEADQIDEIELFLAYQAKLYLPLQLNEKMIGEMLYFDSARVTQEDLNIVLVETQKWENENFPTWVAEYSPWQATMARIAPARYKAAQEARYKLLEDPTFQEEVSAQLREWQLENYAEARDAIQKTLTDKKTAEIFLQLTRDVLEEHQLLHLLDKKW